MNQGEQVAGTKWWRAPFHPILFAVYPIAFLYAQNVQGHLRPQDVVAPLLIALAGTVVVMMAFRLVFHDLHRAAIVTSLLVILVFSFGHVSDVVNPVGSRFPEGILLLGWGLLLVAGTLALAKPKTWFHSVTGGLNVIAFVLCTMNIVPIVRFEQAATDDRLPVATVPGLDAPSGPLNRDIYYLIFDRYASDRTLRDLYGFDNSDFSGWLDDHGFYVAHESLGNYVGTTHSLASSLNMTYLDDLAAEVGRSSGDWDPLTDSLAGSRVATSFQQIGYRYYHIGSWWSATGVDPVADENILYDRPLAFRDLVFDSTILPTLGRWLGIGEGASHQRRQWQRVLFQFDALERISKDPAPTFTFAHFTLPHPPYVFEADGSFVPPEVAAERMPMENYLAQLQFTNAQVEELVHQLLDSPAGKEPIIVLQSDEGPNPTRYEEALYEFVWPEATDAELGEKFLILNALFLPGLDESGLYSTISPVNTFRLILSRYFGAELPLLPDRSYVFEKLAHPYRFTDVTARLGHQERGASPLAPRGR